ncbi:glycosyltransferase [Thioclava sp.]|uniref:glycosyltransferase family protein n=1 Tax=Thioclava sp. TaxID=1933450 RepID=UPI0032422CF2
MRLFQNSGLARSYRTQLSGLARSKSSFKALRDKFLDERYGASHMLKPVLERASDAFFTNGDDEDLQRAWAREHGMKPQSSLEDILLAQIEEHRTEVFYNLDPIRYPSRFLKRLPGSVRRSLCWRAAPSGSVDFGDYDLILNNFPSILEGYERIGWKGAYFFPAHDPEFTRYAANESRPVDVVFVGGYTQYHATRAAVLETVAEQAGSLNIIYYLDKSRMAALAETPLGWVGPLARHKRPRAIRKVSQPPVFGRAFYDALSKARIVLNGAIDMAGQDRGNMRCFETMGAQACLVSDVGNYPEGMEDGKTARFYETPQDAVRIVQTLIETGEDRSIAGAGYDMVRSVYSKERQWERFQELAS